MKQSSSERSHLINAVLCALKAGLFYSFICLRSITAFGSVAHRSASAERQRRAVLCPAVRCGTLRFSAVQYRPCRAVHTLAYMSGLVRRSTPHQICPYYNVE